jgi:hypothetical protein
MTAKRASFEKTPYEPFSSSTCQGPEENRLMQSYSLLWELIFTKFLRKCMAHVRLVDKIGDYLPEEIAGFAFLPRSGRHFFMLLKKVWDYPPAPNN